MCRVMCVRGSENQRLGSAIRGVRCLENQRCVWLGVCRVQRIRDVCG